MKLSEWADWMKNQEKYDACIYQHKIKVPWKKGQPWMTFIKPPVYLFEWQYGLDPFPDTFGAN